MENKSYFKWIIWSLTAVFYFYEFVLRVSPSVIVPELMETFNITASSVGILTSFFIYAYAPMQIPVGMLMDHFGIKKILSIACIVCGIGAFIFALTKYLALASLGRLLIGAGSSFGFISMVYVTIHWFSVKKRAFLIGVANSLAMLGAFAGEGPLSTFIKDMGWRNAMSIFGFFGFFLGALIYLVFKFDKEDRKIEKQTSRVKSHIFENLKSVASKKNTWINALTALFLYMTTTTFAGLWGLSFVEKAYGVTKEIAGYAMSMVFAGWLIGGPLTGILSDYLGKRKVAIRIGIIGVLICLIPVIYMPFINIYIVYVLLFLVGLFSSAELLNFSLAIELNSFKAKATAAAFTNFLISCGDAIFQPLVGFLLDKTWSGNFIQGIREYTIKDYQIALMCLPIALIIAFILIFFIKEESSKKQIA